MGAAGAIVRRVHPRARDRLVAVHQVFALAEAVEKDCHRAELVNDIVGYLYKLAELCPIIFLRGNHDCIDPTTPFFKFMGTHGRISWINEPEFIELPDLGKCLFLPHTRDHKKDWGSLLHNFYKHNVTWIFAHNTFEGADAGGGRRLSGINPKIFDGWKIVSGDIHVPQTFDNVTYVGAPYTINFGDDYEGRVLLFNDKSHKLESIPTSCPQKRLIEIPNNVTEVGLRRLGKKIYVGDIIKIKVNLRSEQYGNWPEVQAKVRAWGEEAGAIVHAVVPVKASTTLKLEQRSPIMGEVVVDPELVRTFVKRRGAAPDVLKTGLWLMEQV
jgi:hypothetical protein